jgi:hypothetical protein
MIKRIGGGQSDWAKQWEAQKKIKQRRAHITTMFGQMGEQSKAAEAASDARYQQMLDIADKTTGQRGADIRSDAAGQSAASMQRLARLGMGNTTVAPTMQMGIEREKQGALNRLADTMQGTKLGILGQQAAAGERFAAQRMGLLGQQATMRDPGEALEIARIGAEPQMMEARRKRAFSAKYQGLQY